MAIGDSDFALRNHALAITTARELYSALLKLEPDQQRVLTLRLVGLGTGEIALILGKDRCWLDTTLENAVYRLRELIGMSGS
jgi:DNA-directed RNA polymerase specialized sigma24 family protein